MPAKVNFRYDFGVDLEIGVPPVPTFPGHLGIVGGECDESDSVQEEEGEEKEEGMSASGGNGNVESCSPEFYGSTELGWQLVDALLPASIQTQTQTLRAASMRCIRRTVTNCNLTCSLP